MKYVNENDKLKQKYDKELRDDLFNRNGRNEELWTIAGCSIADLRRHFEYQFDKHTNWENYHDCWNIDHICPASWFTLSERHEKRECYHWTNLRPLDFYKNCAKGDRIEGERLFHYEEHKHLVPPAKEVYDRLLGRTKPETKGTAPMKTVTATHPALPTWTLTFDPATHRYLDQESREYVSATRFVHRFFEPFDAPAAAARVASRTPGADPQMLLVEWAAKRDASADYGHHVHAYAEALINGTPQPAPATEQEAAAFAVVASAVSALRDAYDLYSAEQIVFCPLYRIAGTMDLVGRNKATGALVVLDWKTCGKPITDDAYGRVALPPIAHVPDSKQAKYALQLSLYAWLLTDSGYFSADTAVELALIHVAPGADAPLWIPLPYLADEVAAMAAAWLETGPWSAALPWPSEGGDGGGVASVLENDGED